MIRVLIAFCVLALSLSLGSCSLKYVGQISKKKVAKSDCVYVVGKISFDPDLKQNLDGLAVGWDPGMLYVLFKKNDTEPCSNGFQSDINAYQKWGEYFVWEVPREKLYMRTIMILMSKEGGDSTTLYIKNKIVFDFAKDEPFVYIGDLTYQLNGKNKKGESEPTLKVDDNYSKALEMFSDYVTAKDGKPLDLKKKIVAGGPVEAELEGLSIRRM